jgi:hypothetical protein
MRITERQLRQIIREERARLLREWEESIIRVGNELYKVDDEGNEEYYSEYDPGDPEFGHLEDGGVGVPLERSGGYGGGYGRGRGRW